MQMRLWAVVACVVFPLALASAARAEPCEFDGLPSSLTLCADIFSGCATALPIKGAMQVNCTDSGPGAKNCSCQLGSFDPVTLPGIGVVCVSATDLEGNIIQCEDRPYECNGGAPLGIDLETSATIGSCTGNEDCAGKCDAYCANLTKTRFNSGCDLFCQGGERNDMPCQCDTKGASTCPIRRCELMRTQECKVDADCPPVTCVGDCNDDDAVQMNELITGVSIALGQKLPDKCTSLSQGGQVGIDDLITAVNNALDRCPSSCKGPGKCSVTTSRNCQTNGDCPGAEACIGQEVLDCPLGQCVGKDLEQRSDCQCWCINEADGPPAEAGAMQCQLGVRIVVEAASSPSGYCDGNGVLVRLPPLCAPLTSEVYKAIIVNANEQIGSTIGPVTQTGAGLECPTFDTGVTTGLNLVTNLVFFDSTIGDLLTKLNIHCTTPPPAGQ